MSRRLPPDWMATLNERVIRQAERARSVRFFTSLPGPVRDALGDHLVSRQYGKGDRLRGVAPGAGEVHFVLSGCVAERTTSAGSATLRFRGADSLLGDVEIVNEAADPAAAECLTTTWTLSCAMSRMRMLAESDISIMKGVAASIAERLETNDRVYANSRHSPIQRVCTLLLELHRTSGTSSRLLPDSSVEVSGPTQAELGEALMLGRATIENVMAEMRMMGILTTGHRHYAVKHVDVLRSLAEGKLTSKAKAGKGPPPPPSPLPELPEL
ncbi:Crp/Fnr family transcriptional regulator [Streptomyces olivoreticuli]|uniref:Crp/Fnr family transcriptional regulator n=1 Tax=Streptomyces olivoreticuli TaxID=68246 RepID=UPI0013C376E1|nr:Crp/Fnr family transcriptional regulator [Streptomyces olivoreticuli]